MMRLPIKEWANRTGQAGLYVLSLCAFLAPAGAATGMALLALGFVLAAPDWRGLTRQPVVATALLFSAYLIVHTAAAGIRDPAASKGLWDAAGDWLQLLIFVPFAYLLAGDERKLGRLLALALLGMITGMLARLDWGLLLASPEELFASRPGFGYPAIAFALYSGSALLGLIFLARRWWASGQGARGNLLIALLWLFCLVLLIQGFVAAQSRGSWIALGLALLVGGLLARRLKPSRRSAAASRQERWLIALGLLVGASLLAINGERIMTRMSLELEAAGALVASQQAEEPQFSFGLRWNVLRYGLDRWLERPWLGWGAGSSRGLIERTGDPKLRQDEIPLKHLHNSYLEVLLQFGVVGAALLGALFVYLTRGLWRSVREGRCPTDYGVWLLTTLLFTLVWSLWDYRAVHQDWRIFWVLLAGTSLSFALVQTPLRPSGKVPVEGFGP